MTFSSFYKEALDNMVLYNSNLRKERRSRLPYIDAQTGIAQRGESKGMIFRLAAEKT